MPDQNNLYHLLVVDDDSRLRTLLQRYLIQEGFLVSTAIHLAQARQMLSLFLFDTLIIDIMMPGERGTELLVKKNTTVLPPVLFLSARGEAQDRVTALQLGAEDYMVKPFEPKELVLRIKTILRRHDQKIFLGKLEYDKKRRLLMRGSTLVSLTSLEEALLHYFVSHPHQLVPRKDILQTLFPHSLNDRIVDVQINRLKKKLGEEGARSIASVRGQGYCFKPTSS